MTNKNNILIYNCFDNPYYRETILAKCHDIEIKNHINDLYQLIKYQISIIDDQRRQIISNQHKNVWHQYDNTREIN